MNKLYLIRHGETIWNKIGIIQGQADISLTKKGEKQAFLVSNKLKDANIRHIYSSDLNRAYDTAKIIAKNLDISVSKKEELREINFGAWQGFTIKYIKKAYNKEYEIWRNEPYLLTIPKGESLIKVQERVMRFINRLDESHKYNNILIVSHSVVIKVIILGLLDLDLVTYRKFSISNCGLTIIEFIEKRKVIKCLNERIL
ncbi:histidine phosphatase family protein [Clostridium sp. D2Q-14]|uniref:histidine phosphatase family protein n=1 Tax=Anaeromonas gelatinilytica TaxID=2683194 RepID=UPI00193B6B74|nr:histidine phosphatase family protein [Anaeromonas gelatinilytica]MBS4536252.1 histidine phosphatase family protein [Anaeromonas gelatinilytica]